MSKQKEDLSGSLEMTELHKAAAIGNYAGVESLLTKGAKVDAQNEKRQSALHCALFLPMIYDPLLKQNKIKIFNALFPLMSVEKLSLQDSEGNTLLHLAIIYGFESIIPDILAKDSSLSLMPNFLNQYPIHLAILSRQENILKMLLEVPKMIELTDLHGKIPLHIAASYGTKTMVEACTSPENINARDNEENTPLLSASYYGNLKAIETLIALGADVTAKNDRGFNLLHIAVEQQNLELVNWLLEHIEQPLLLGVDNDNQTPLHYAQISQNDAIIQSLTNAQGDSSTLEC